VRSRAWAGSRAGGANGSGQLGNGTTAESSGRVDVSSLAGGITAIAAGDDHTCALTSGGGINCWGANDNGQLGNRTTTNSSVPVDVSGLASGVSAIAAGGANTCALLRNGAVRCWGDNHAGQLGNGTKANSSVPVAVSGLASGVSAITTGGHTCALTNAGGVKCWGANDLGELGNGTTANSSVPVAVSGLTRGVSAIAAGRIHTCAITSGGRVKCWGSNYLGELGIGTTKDSHVPVDVPALPNGITAVAAGNSHTCALTGGGRVTCWGSNHHGQLGNGSTTDSGVPVDVPGLPSGVGAITAGDIHTCALTSGGTVRCWGDNFLGQLGLGTPCDSSVPVDVPVDANVTAPSFSPSPTDAPNARIEHAAGPRDVVLRFDNRPDLGVSDLTGELFQPGPEFTLYGDGTVIFRNEMAQPPRAEGPIIRARPFRIAHLNERQVQSLLRFALGQGGLATACDRYETRDVDRSGVAVFSVRAGGFDKRVEVFAFPKPLAALADELRNFDRTVDLSTKVWVPSRYWGSLLAAGPYIDEGLLPDPKNTGTKPWPWPGIAPDAFVRPLDPSLGGSRRVMSRTEASVLGLSDDGGVVKRIYLVGPNGKTIYSFSLWPMLPDEKG